MEIWTHTGFWINWESGRVKGATLTLSLQSAGLLAAFLAIFITFTGSMFWRILSFILHQRNTVSLNQEKHMLHYQRQVILRNSSNLGAFLSFLQYCKKPKQKGGNLSRTSLLYAVLALLCFVGFGIAGIFSSSISKTAGSLHILRGTICGQPDLGGLTNSKRLADAYNAAAYVRDCYSTNSNVNACKSFVQQSIPFSVDKNMPCPFGDKCYVPGFRMDTGRMSSQHHFGINARPADRADFRRVATCAVLTNVPVSINNHETRGPLIHVNLGPMFPGANYTFEYAQRSSQELSDYWLKSLQHLGLPPRQNTSTYPHWQAVSPFNLSDADVSLFMLAQNSVKYTTPVDDPWFGAHDKQNGSDIGRGSRPIYFKDHILTFLACADQYQVCNPNLEGDSGCTSLTSALNVLDEITTEPIITRWNRNGGMFQSAIRFIAGHSDKNMCASVQGRSFSALNAVTYAYDTVSEGLPEDQWQREVSNWFQVSLAKEQAFQVEWATGPRNLNTSATGQVLKPSVIPPLNLTEAKAQCNQQLVHGNGQYVNFSVFGLGLTLAFGLTIIILGLSIDTMTGAFRSAPNLYKKKQWEQDEVMALHTAVVGTAADNICARPASVSTDMVHKDALPSDENSSDVSLSQKPIANA